MKTLIKSTAGFLAILTALCCAACGSSESESSVSGGVKSQTAIISNNGTNYYCSPSLYKMVDNNTFEPVRMYDEETMSSTTIPDKMKEYYEKTGEKYEPKVLLDQVCYHPLYMVYSEGEFYGLYDENLSSIVHLSFTESDIVKKEDLYTQEDLKSVVQKILESTDYDEKYIKESTLSSLDNKVEYLLREEYEKDKDYDEIDSEKEDKYVNDNKESYKKSHYDELYAEVYKTESDSYYENAENLLIASLYNPIDGEDGYIYSALRGFKDTIEEYYPLDSKLVRFAKDGSKYEVIDGVSASAMTMYNGYIYYYNSGAHEDDDSSTSDANVRGIYKMKPDGSENKKIADINLEYDTNQYTKVIYNMTIYNGNIYFIKYDDSFDLYRVSTNGGTPEKYSEMHCCNYTIDQSSNTLYYVGVEKSTVESTREVIIKDLSDGSEKKIEYTDSSTKGVICRDYQDSIQINGDYLYINSGEFYHGFGLVDLNGRTISINDGSDKEITITEPEYQMYRNIIGERLNIKTGKLEYFFCYKKVRIEDDIYRGEYIAYEEPSFNTEWKSSEEVHQILEPIYKKYNIN